MPQRQRQGEEKRQRTAALQDAVATNCTALVPRDLGVRLPSAAFIRMDIDMRRLFYCVSLILLSVGLSHSATTTEQKHLLVIAPKAFCPALDSFTTHKQKLLPTDLKPLEEILSATTGVDDPEKLKRYLYNEWKNHNLGYALLVEHNGTDNQKPSTLLLLERPTNAAASIQPALANNF